MPAFNLDAWVARSGALDLSAVPWEDVPRHPIGPEKIGTLRPLAEPLDRVIVDESRQVLLCYQHEETRPQVRDPGAGEERHVAIRRADQTTRRLPGFASVPLLEVWMDRNIGRSSSVSGGHNGHGHH